MSTALFLSKHPGLVIFLIFHIHNCILFQTHFKITKIGHALTFIQSLVMQIDLFEFVFESGFHSSSHHWCFTIIVIVIVIVFVISCCNFILYFVWCVFLQSFRAYLHLFKIMCCLFLMFPWTLDEYFLCLVPVLLWLILCCKEFLKSDILILFAHVEPHFFFSVRSSFISLSFECIKTWIYSQVFRLPPFIILISQFLFLFCLVIFVFKIFNELCNRAMSLFLSFMCIKLAQFGFSCTLVFQFNFFIRMFMVVILSNHCKEILISILKAESILTIIFGLKLIFINIICHRHIIGHHFNAIKYFSLFLHLGFDKVKFF